MGMQDGRAGRVFLSATAILGLVGAAIGIGAGLGLITVFSAVGSDASFPIKPQLGTAISFVVAILVALASSIIPWRRTSKPRPHRGDSGWLSRCSSLSDSRRTARRSGPSRFRTSRSRSGAASSPPSSASPLRQVDAANLIGLLDTPTTGRVILDRVDTSTADAKVAPGCATGRSASSSSSTTCCPSSACWRTCSARTHRRRVVIKRAIMPGGAAPARPGGAEDKERQPAVRRAEQRVAIARALLNDPALVLADEPPATWTANTAAVCSASSGASTASSAPPSSSSHDRSVAQQTDRILEVRDGRLVQDVRNTYISSALAG
jgi:hypothetical protein